MVARTSGSTQGGQARRVRPQRGVVVACLWLIPSVAAAQPPPAGIDEALRRIAAIADTPASKQAAQRLWRVPLDAPVLVHDRASGTSWQRDAVTGAVKAVALRKDQPPANTCITIDGTPRVLLLLPLPDKQDALTTLFWHEQWHCVQSALGLPAAEGDTAHLDGEAGRTALRLEMRALGQALVATHDHQARQHAAAALEFRALRSHSTAPPARALAEEANVERNEGLAEYTGRMIAAAGKHGDPVPAVVDALAQADASQSFVRSAAYATGPAYGILLDRWSPQWRTNLSSDSDLPALLADGLGVPVGGADTVRARNAYGRDGIGAEERERATARERRSVEYRGRFLGTDAVRLTLSKPSVSFDPRSLFPLDDAGTVYTPLTVRDEWGELTSASGALLSKDWSLLSLGGGEVEGEASTWKGPGWTLVLNDGWSLGRQADGWTLAKGRGGQD